MNEKLECTSVDWILIFLGREGRATMPVYRRVHLRCDSRESQQGRADLSMP